MPSERIPDLSRSRAVLVGTWDYTDLPPVAAVENSFTTMAGLLTSRVCGWPADRVTSLVNVERPADLPCRLIDLFGDAEDVALFYYVGHGQSDDRGRLCLGLVETKSDARYRAATSLEFDDVRNALRHSNARTKIVVLDCCFAGLAIQPEAALGPSLDVADHAVCEGAYTMAASAAFEIARYEQSENATGKPLTYFTKCLAEVVLDGVPDEGPTLSLDDIFRGLFTTMRAQGLPEPTQANRGTAATFPFCRNAARWSTAETGGMPLADSPPRFVLGRRMAILLALLVALAASVMFLAEAGNEPSGESASPTARQPADRRPTGSDAQSNESVVQSPPVAPDTQPHQEPPPSSGPESPGTVTGTSSPYPVTALLLCRNSNNDFVFRLLPVCSAPYNDGKWSVGSGYLAGQDAPDTVPLYEHYCTGGNPNKGNKCHGFAENRYYSRGSTMDLGSGWTVQDSQVRVVSECARTFANTDGNPDDGLQPIFQVLYFENNQTVRKYTVRSAGDLSFPGLGTPNHVEFLGCTLQ
jgi:hypothetical protein